MYGQVTKHRDECPIRQPVAKARIDEALLCEQLVGLTTASEVCARWLDRDEPDFGEVRQLVSEMIAVSRRALAAFDC